MSNIEIGKFKINDSYITFGNILVKYEFFLKKKINIANIKTIIYKHKLSPKLLR